MGETRMPVEPATREDLQLCLGLVNRLASEWQEAGEDPAAHHVLGVPLTARTGEVLSRQRPDSVKACAAYAEFDPYLRSLSQKLATEGDLDRARLFDPNPESGREVLAAMEAYNQVAGEEYATRGLAAAGGGLVAGAYQFWKTKGPRGLRGRAAIPAAILGLGVAALAAGEATEGNHLPTRMRSMIPEGPQGGVGRKMAEPILGRARWIADVVEESGDAALGIAKFMGEYVVYDQIVRRGAFQVALTMSCGGRPTNGGAAWAKFQADRSTAWAEMPRKIGWPVGAAQSPFLPPAWAAYGALSETPDAVAVPAFHAFQNGPQALATKTDMFRWVAANGPQYCQAGGDRRPDRPNPVGWLAAKLAALAGAAKAAAGNRTVELAGGSKISPPDPRTLTTGKARSFAMGAAAALAVAGTVALAYVAAGLLAASAPVWAPAAAMVGLVVLIGVGASRFKAEGREAPVA